MYEAAARCKDIARAPVTNWEPHGLTLAGYCYAVRHGMKFQLVTPYRVSHLQRYGVTVRDNVTSVYPPLNSSAKNIVFLGRKNIGGAFDVPCTPSVTSVRAVLTVFQLTHVRKLLYSVRIDLRLGRVSRLCSVYIYILMTGHMKLDLVAVMKAAEPNGSRRRKILQDCRPKNCRATMPQFTNL